MLYNKLMIWEIILIILSYVFVAVGGVLSIVLPFLPGVPLAWLGILIFAITTNFTVVSLKAVLIFLLLSILAMAIDFAAPFLGATKYKASKEGLIASFLGTIVGVLFFGPLGLLFGGFVGLVLGEMYKGKEPDEVGGVLKGAFIGFLAGGAVKLALAAAMIAYLISATFKL